MREIIEDRSNFSLIPTPLDIRSALKVLSLLSFLLLVGYVLLYLQAFRS